ncbi:hypothetical protein [Phenylobacterium sp.]
MNRAHSAKRPRTPSYEAKQFIGQTGDGVKEPLNRHATIDIAPKAIGSE